MRSVNPLAAAVFVLLSVLSSCKTEPVPEGKEPAGGSPDAVPAVTFTFSTEAISSRTALTAGGKVEWAAGDSISVFSGSKNQKVTAGASGGEVSFSGDVESAAGYYALYPYNAGASIDGNVITSVIPGCQRGIREGFDPAAQLMTGHTEGTSFRMKNVISLVRINIPESVTSVKLTSNDGRKIAGAVSITVGSDGIPTSTTAELASVTLLPTGATFETGTYYIAAAPGVQPAGLQVEMTRSGGNDPLIAAKGDPCTFWRSEITNLVIMEEKFHPEAVDRMPDFSRVGYHYGDRDIPDVPVRVTLNPPADPDADSWETIQNAINTIPTPGAVLLKAGTWKVSQGLKISRSGVVLRGEGASTTLYCTAETQIPNLIQIGNVIRKTLGSYSNITGGYVPCGQMWVSVADPSMFSTGDHVFIYRPATNDWLDAIHMREIPMNASGTTEQWDSASYGMYWDRIVTAVEADRVFFDNPVVMGIGTPEGASGDWGSGRLYKGSWPRVKECGVENLVLDTRYGGSVDESGNYIDEEHAWSAVEVYAAQHCWVAHMTSRHFGYCCVNLRGGSKNVTVVDCHSADPVSQITGSRRYAFHFYGSELCLVRDCTCDKDRHQFVTGPRVPGPNVFYNCSATNTMSDCQAGPHQRWATGCLWDNVVSDARIEIQDRSWSGTGHGWTAVNSVLYNCEAPILVCQSPWASGQNWATGCIGEKADHTWDYWGTFGDTRPDGIWTSPGVHVTPASLYYAQLEARHSSGSDLSALIADDGDGNISGDSFTYDSERNDYLF